MGLFDQIKNSLTSAISREARQTINKAVNNATNAATQAVKNIGKGGNSSKTFKFDSLPTNLAELKAFPEASLDTAFKTTALAILALTRYEQDPEAFMEMLEFLNGPDDAGRYQRQYFDERIKGKAYKVTSFFDGATTENDYKPSTPYTITVYENPYSFDEENWATMYVKSSGADSPRPVKLRKKPSTGQWFINDIQCFSDIRIPKAADPWA